jgi:hypothetical protein
MENSMRQAAPDSYEQRTRAEQLAIWTLRRIAQDSASPFAVHRRRPSRTWQDLEEIVELLRGANRRLQQERGVGLAIGSPGHLGITSDERAFLRATAAAQVEAEELLARELAGLLAGSRARFLFRRAVSLLAAVLAANDNWLPQPVVTKDQRMQFGTLVARCDALPSLDHALLWTMRAWVLGQCRKRDTGEQIRQVFQTLGAPEGDRQLDRFMRALSHGARRSLEVNCVCNPHVSADEARLLDVFRLQQQERHDEAFETLLALAGEFAAITGCDSANRIALALAECGQTLSVVPPTSASRWHSTVADAGLHRLH